MPSVHPVVMFLRYVRDNHLADLSDESAKVLLALLSHCNWDLKCFVGESTLMEECGKSHGSFYAGLSPKLRTLCDRWQVSGRKCYTQFHLPANYEPRREGSGMRSAVQNVIPQGSDIPDARGPESRTRNSNTEVALTKSSKATASGSPGITATEELLSRRGITGKPLEQLTRQWAPHQDVLGALVGSFDKKPKAKRNPGLLVTMLRQDGPKILEKRRLKEEAEKSHVQNARANTQRDREEARLNLEALQIWQKAGKAKRVQICEKIHFAPGFVRDKERFMREEPGRDIPGQRTMSLLREMAAGE